jgi:4-hydroxy-2-oxoheptanedioate aldolase
VSIPHPVSAEICARQGLDLLCIDAEHAMIDRADVEAMVRSCDLGGTAAMVRVPSSAPEWIATALDAGAEAVLVPRVSSVDVARDIVAASRLPPLGLRGAGPGRASGYGYDIQAYVGTANEHILVAVQIETMAGLDCVEEIAAVEGIDMLFVGPFDLALSLGAVGEDGAARLDQAIKRVAAAGREAGKALGIFRPSAADLPHWREYGFGLFLIGSDAMFMGRGLAEMRESARSREAG